MDFLKKIFGGGGGGGNNTGDRDVLYLYVRPKMCEEILEVRVDLKHSLSQKDDGSGYFLRKLVSGTRCPFQSELTLEFDDNRRLISKSIDKGEYVTADDYNAKQADAAP